QFLKQSCIFDGYYGLPREVAKQLNLFVRERSHLTPIYSQCSDDLAIFDHRYECDGACAGQIGEIANAFDSRKISRAKTNVLKMESFLGLDQLFECGSRYVADNWITLHEFRERSWNVMKRDVSKQTVFAAQMHDAKFSVADACRILQHLLKHRLQAAWRATDHLQNFRRCCLLLQRFTQLIQQARVLDADD